MWEVEDDRDGVDTMEQEETTHNKRNLMNCFFFYINHMYINKSYTDFVKKKKLKKYKHLYLLNKLFFSVNVLFHFWASARMWLAKWSSCPAISCNGAATRLPLRTVFFIFNFFGLLWELFFFCLPIVVHLSRQFTFSFFNLYRY